MGRMASSETMASYCQAEYEIQRLSITLVSALYSSLSSTLWVERCLLRCLNGEYCEEIHRQVLTPLEENLISWYFPIEFNQTSEFTQTRKFSQIISWQNSSHWKGSTTLSKEGSSAPKCWLNILYRKSLGQFSDWESPSLFSFSLTSPAQRPCSTWGHCGP